MEREFSEEHYKQFEPVIRNAIRRIGMTNFIPYEDCLQEGRLVYLRCYQKYDISQDMYFGMYLKVSVERQMFNLMRSYMRWGTVESAWSLDNTNHMQEAFVNHIKDDFADVELQFFVDEQLYYLDDYFMNSEYKAVYELDKDGYSQSDIGVLLGMSQPTVSREIGKIREITQRYFEEGVCEYE